MAIRNTIFADDHDTTAPATVEGPTKPTLLRVTLANGKTMEVARPRIIRSKRLDTMTLSREVVRSLGRLEARNRDIGKIKARQLKLDLKK